MTSIADSALQKLGRVATWLDFNAIGSGYIGHKYLRAQQLPKSTGADEGFKYEDGSFLLARGPGEAMSIWVYDEPSRPSVDPLPLLMNY